jgi:16S rRNA (cytidine1402-2'-O)-methyltransferase
MTGRLVVVGTPIGNLGDLSPRAAEALRVADLVVAEDTRVAAKLLRFIGAGRPTISFTAHNAASRVPELLGRLGQGDTLALTTDAGMPAVSDPGAELVAAARSAGHVVEVVPGPSAVTAALALAGVSGSGFLFGGFLPARPPTARFAALERLVTAAGGLGLPLVLFEAPHRVSRLLGELDRLTGVHPDLRVAAGRELTKVHEEVAAGTPAEVAAALPTPRGEFTLVVSGLAEPAPGPWAPAVDAASIADAAISAGLSDRTITDLLRAASMPRREAYQLVRERRKGAVTQQ